MENKETLTSVDTGRHKTYTLI